MKKLYIAAFCFAALLVGCSKSDSTANNKPKTAIDVDLTAYVGYMGANLATVQAAYKNNIDTQLVSTDTTLFAVQMKDSVQTGTPLYVIYEVTSGIVSEIFVTGIGTSTLTNNQTIARKYGDLSKTAFGDVYVCGTLLNGKAQKGFSTLGDLWSYLDANGYSAFDQYNAYWNYNQKGIVLIYSNSSGFEWAVQNKPWNTSASAAVLQNKLQLVKRAIFANR